MVIGPEGPPQRRNRLGQLPDARVPADGPASRRIEDAAAADQRMGHETFERGQFHETQTEVRRAPRTGIGNRRLHGGRSVVDPIAVRSKYDDERREREARHDIIDDTRPLGDLAPQIYIDHAASAHRVFPRNSRTYTPRKKLALRSVLRKRAGDDHTNLGRMMRAHDTLTPYHTIIQIRSRMKNRRSGPSLPHDRYRRRTVGCG